MELEQELDEDMELALEEARLKKGIRVYVFLSSQIWRQYADSRCTTF